MCPIQTRVQLHCKDKNFNSCNKEEHLKGSHHQFDAAKTLKKTLKESEIAISSILDRSNLQNFSTWCQPCWHLMGS